MILFYWDGISDIVKDVDYFLWGGTDEGVSKGPDEGYNQDTSLELQSYIQKHEDYFTYVRANNYSENNIFHGNEKGNGNGITGDDETSENINSTWKILKNRHNRFSQISLQSRVSKRSSKKLPTFKLTIERRILRF